MEGLAVNRYTPQILLRSAQIWSDLLRSTQIDLFSGELGRMRANRVERFGINFRGAAKRGARESLFSGENVGRVGSS